MKYETFKKKFVQGYDFNLTVQEQYFLLGIQPRIKTNRRSKYLSLSPKKIFKKLNEVKT